MGECFGVTCNSRIMTARLLPWSTPCACETSSSGTKLGNVTRERPEDPLPIMTPALRELVPWELLPRAVSDELALMMRARVRASCRDAGEFFELLLLVPLELKKRKRDEILVHNEFEGQQRYMVDLLGFFGLGQVQAFRDDGVGNAQCTAIIKKDAKMTGPDHNLLYLDLDLVKGGECMRPILVQFVGNFSDSAG